MAPWGLLALLSACIVGFYYRLLDRNEILVQRDALRLLVPLRIYLVERVRSGEFPLWYPFDGLGRPFVDTAASGLFHPFTLLFLVLNPYAAYKVAALASCGVGALAALLLARRIGVSSSAGLVIAGFVQALAGYSASLTENLVYLVAPTLLPLFLLALDCAQASRRHMIAAAGLWASPFLIGDPQGGFLFGVLAVGWAAWRSPRDLPRSVVPAALLAALLAAAQLVPLWSVYRTSARHDSTAFREQALRFSTAPQRLVQLAVTPGTEAFEAERVAREVFDSDAWGYWSRSIYLGLPALGLAVLALRRRARQLWPLGASAAFFVLLALGSRGVLYDFLFRFVPFWSAFRYPEKMIGFATAPVALLAAHGADLFVKGARSLGWWLAAAIGALIAVVLLIFDERMIPVAGFPFAASTAVAWAAACAAILGSISLALSKQLLRPALGSAALIVLVYLDLWRANQHAYRTGPQEIAEFTPPLLEALQKTEGPESLGRYRLLAVRQTRVAFPRALGEQLGADAAMVSTRNALDEEFNSLFNIESPSAYLPGEPAALKAMLMDGPYLGTLGHFNTKYLIDSEEGGRLRGLAATRLASLRGYDLALYANPEPVKPRAYLSTRVIDVHGPQDWKRLVEQDDFQRGNLDYVELNGRTLPDPLGHGEVHVERYRPEEVAISFHVDHPAVLVLSDSFDPGWEARLDDNLALEVLRANGLVRAVIVPEGLHHVVFRYKPVRVYVGAALSALGLLLSFLLWVAQRGNGRPSS